MTHQDQCLAILVEQGEPEGGFCLSFNYIVRMTGLTRPQVKRAVRRLARAGLAEYHRALWNEDGPAGAGYCPTKKAVEARG